MFLFQDLSYNCREYRSTILIFVQIKVKKRCKQRLKRRDLYILNENITLLLLKFKNLFSTGKKFRYFFKFFDPLVRV